MLEGRQRRCAAPPATTRSAARNHGRGASMSRNTKRRRARRLASAAVLVLAALTLFCGSAPRPPRANRLPMDLGIQKGFFSAQGLEIKKTTLQSGNDIVLALGSNKVDLGYVGYAPALI